MVKDESGQGGRGQLTMGLTCHFRSIEAMLSVCYERRMRDNLR